MEERIRSKYEKEAVPKLMEEFKYSNRMQVPKVTRVVLNMGLGKAIVDPKVIDVAVSEMATISGQKPVITRAKKAIANFKLRQGMPIGCMVTLRRRKMYEFLDRLINVALPRVRDFKGVSPKAFDGRGGYTLGVREHNIFPEVNLDKIEKAFGLNITFVTSARTPKETRSLLVHLGMPFRKN